MEWGQFWIVGIIALIVGVLLGSIAFPVQIEKDCPKCAVCTVCEVCDTCEVCTVCDNSVLNSVLNHIYDNDGNIEYLIIDLDDDEAFKIPERVVFIDGIKQIAVDSIRAELFDEIDKRILVDVDNNITIILDEDEMTRLRIDDDKNELIVDVTDWEDLEGTVAVTGKFKQDDYSFTFSCDVVFEDGEYDELDNVVVNFA